MIAKSHTYRNNSGKRGRPTIDAEIEEMIVQFARENSRWGYDRIVGALANLLKNVSKQTIANVLERNGVSASPDRRRKFIKSHLNVMRASDFFSVDILTPFGLVTVYVLFFIHLKTRKVSIGGISRNPNKAWMAQIARNVTGCDGELVGTKYLIHDRDDKYCPAFDHMLEDSGVKIVKLPPRSPNLNAFAERWVRSVKEECLRTFVFFSKGMVECALRQYVEHYNSERNHQGIENTIPFPDERLDFQNGDVVKSERLGGLLNYYHRERA